jgi:uncharacterized membrane protein
MGLRTRRLAYERLLVLGGLGVASALCGLLELVRERHFHTLTFRFMGWNLVLAWIPLLLALFVYDRYRRGTALHRLAPAVVLWLLFLPNAPYILTDFIHLSPSPPVPLWFDGLYLSAFAWTGLLLGFVSLYLLHAVVRHRYGARAGWAGVMAALPLTSIGIYLGRFKNWNSWDLIVQPGRRLAELNARLSDPSSLGRAIGATVALTVLLALAYLVFYALLSTRLESSIALRARDQKG